MKSEFIKSKLKKKKSKNLWETSFKKSSSKRFAKRP